MKTELTEMFEIQERFTQKIFHEKFSIDIYNMSKEDAKRWNKEMILSCAKEVFEMLDELNWKTHRHSNHSDNIDNFIEEGVDAFKYLLNLFILNGVDSELFYSKFIEKSSVVDIRYEQEKKLSSAIHSDKKFVVFDIDGVLNDYPNNVIRFWKSLGYEYESISEFKQKDISSYNKMKKQFRLAGEERNCTINNDAKLSIDRAISQGFGIILLTSRPYEKITRLFYDTVFWLEKHEIKYDYLFFSKNKEAYLIDNFKKENIYRVIDDTIENANALSFYFDTFLYTKVSADKLNVNSSIRVISDLNDFV